ncbi:hypothetical protein GF407_00700 [candidate division KSB1 bacterium]|nr:hypothetical protein [candidate division KSB1 bacterium]
MNRIMVFVLLLPACLQAEESFLQVKISEPLGIARDHEYIRIRTRIQMPQDLFSTKAVIAVGKNPADTIVCQLYSQHFDPAGSLVDFIILFPISLNAKETRRLDFYWIPSFAVDKALKSDLAHRGDALSMQVENQYYKASLGQLPDHDGVKGNLSGQLSELLIKSGFDQKLFRTKNLMHWAPNAKRCTERRYKTLGHWNPPDNAALETGPYCIQTTRQGALTGYPEIVISAGYEFLACKPYFLFFSVMDIQQGLCLQRLRNDEMTMDSLFTHVAFMRQNGRERNMLFTERYRELQEEPISNEAPWLAFYHSEKGYGFGVIRLHYSVLDQYGQTSPLAFPHTRISDGAGGGKYWNRYLICDVNTFVPAGSRYMEKNAYLTFTVDREDPLKMMRHYARVLRNPVRVRIVKPAIDFSGR